MVASRRREAASIQSRSADAAPRPLALLHLAAVDADRLAELVTDAWRMRAPETLTVEP
jgi:hypothetical protein